MAVMTKYITTLPFCMPMNSFSLLIVEFIAIRWFSERNEKVGEAN